MRIDHAKDAKGGKEEKEVEFEREREDKVVRSGVIP